LDVSLRVDGGNNDRVTDQARVVANMHNDRDEINWGQLMNACVGTLMFFVGLAGPYGDVLSAFLGGLGMCLVLFSAL